VAARLLLSPQPLAARGRAAARTCERVDLA